MRIRTLFVLVVLLLIAAFVAINWQAVTSVAKFSLVVTTIEAPIGLVMLALLVLVAATFLVYTVVWQSAMLLEARRHARELQSQRALADQAETSRFVELRERVGQEFAQFGERLAALEAALRTEIRDHTNSLAATLGELDDRLRRQRGDGDPP